MRGIDERRIGKSKGADFECPLKSMTIFAKNIALKKAFPIIVSVLFLFSCVKIDVFEKNVAIPGHKWETSFKPTIEFEITDTAQLYNIYVVLRHEDAFRYKNIWLNVGVQPPGEQLQKSRFDLPLATDEKGWMGKGMDDVFEHRIPLYQQTPLKKGKYIFLLENIMREDPLKEVLNVGIRIEKQ